MDGGFLHIAVNVSLVLLITAFLITLIRLFSGPGHSNRIVALDLVASIVMAMVFMYSIIAGLPVYIDIAIVISLISFLGTIAISSILKQK